MRLRILLFMFLIVNVAYSQDIVYLRYEPDSIVARIVEINSAEVKYIPVSDPLPVLYLPKIYIKKIRLANGRVMHIEADGNEAAINQRVASVKCALLGPAFNQFVLSYEVYKGERRSFEYTAAIIGAGYNPDKGNETPLGGYVKAGVKWTATDLFADFSSNPEKIINGIYLKPELTFGKYRIAYPDQWEFDFGRKEYYLFSYPDKKILFGGIQLNAGYQWILGNHLTFDVYVGMGYVFSWQKHNIPFPDRNYFSHLGNEKYFYAFTRLGEESPVCISAGIKIGYTFCTDKRR